MTPAVNQAKKAKINFTLHQYTHDPSSDSYGDEAAEKLGLSQDRVFKTLVIELDSRELAVALVPVSGKLDLKSAAGLLNAKKARMADQKEVERATGYILGGVSPLGQKKSLAFIMDESAREFDTLFVSAGRRGLEIELSPRDLAELTRAGWGRIRK
ncbi:Cys-tRNA(Pro) deacylase [Desulfospira joergensenii]|uniref:Cys-tRNA(Pro) deacylase n=1 Tax=Desulfospira joergensenii TaxID=53329 RepID=UPI0003B41598|nr:Cys-tRNA(Pro) deacylase [Desulfospira joergensenii]